MTRLDLAKGAMENGKGKREKGRRLQKRRIEKEREYLGRNEMDEEGGNGCGFLEERGIGKGGGGKGEAYARISGGINMGISRDGTWEA